MGGRDVIKLTHNIMSSLVSNPLACLYNFQGTKEKHPPVPGVHHLRRYEKTEATDVTVNQAISKELTGSRDRDHGRRKTLPDPRHGQMW